MPFKQAARMIGAMLGVQTTAETARRLTEQAGRWMEEAQPVEADTQAPRESKEELVPQRCVFSADGAMVSLVNKQWVEARTVAIGQPQEKHTASGEQETHVGQLSYFSRLADASTFTHLAEGEMQRRQVREAKEVSAVMDGADWLQFFTDRHRPDAVRILDFPHAAEHLTKLLEALESVSIPFPHKMLDRCLHILKHRGPSLLLRLADRMPADLAQQKSVQEHLDYLRKREALMQYQKFRQQGWPIGSGMVESANKNVVEARLKGAGMHWERTHVNPMLALRNAVCNERWQEMWQQAIKHCKLEQVSHRSGRAEQRRSQLLTAGKLSLPAYPATESAASQKRSASLLPTSKAQALPVPLPTARPAAARPRSSRPFTGGLSHSAVMRVNASHHPSPESSAQRCLCGTPLAHMKGYRTKVYCSDRCRMRAYRERQQQHPQLSPLVPATTRIPFSSQKSPERSAEECPCGTPLVPLRGQRTKGYCSGRCRQRAYRERRRWGV
jgi:hypothetical protein